MKLFSTFSKLAMLANRRQTSEAHFHVQCDGGKVRDTFSTMCGLVTRAQGRPRSERACHLTLHTIFEVKGPFPKKKGSGLVNKVFFTCGQKRLRDRFRKFLQSWFTPLFCLLSVRYEMNCNYEDESLVLGI